MSYLKSLVATAENNYLSNLSQQLKIEHLQVKNFIDIGCYTGDNTLKMAQACNAKHVYGIDVDRKAMKSARDKGISTFYQDICDETWKIEDHKFDFVYSNQVIEHLYSVDNFILNIKRILKKHGYALISTENLAGWHNIFSLIMGYQPFSLTNICTKQWSVGNPLSITKDGHHSPFMIHRAIFTYYALVEFLKMYDFTIIKGITAGYYPLPNNAVGNYMAKLDPRHSVYISVLVRND